MRWFDVATTFAAVWIFACATSEPDLAIERFSAQELSGAIEAAGIPEGVVRSARRGPSEGSLHVEWITKSAAYLVELQSENHLLKVVRDIPCKGWRCYANRAGTLIAWCESENLDGSAVTAHIAGRAFHVRSLAVDASAKYFAVQQENQSVIIGRTEEPAYTAEASPVNLKGVAATPTGALVFGVVDDQKGLILSAESFGFKLTRGAIERLVVPFRHLEIADYVDDSKRVLVLELRDDPLCSRLWTWDIGMPHLTPHGCSSDVSILAP
jgi:hypothetical protein